MKREDFTMLTSIKIIARTPSGESKEYFYIGDIINHEAELFKFMIDCCDDCAQTYGPPEDYNPIDWQDFTSAQWEPIMEIIEELDDDDNNNGGY